MSNLQLAEGEEIQDEDEAFEGAAKRHQRDQNPKPRHICNSRLEELAKPKRWHLLGVWKCFGYLFEPERMQLVKDRVQEQFSMSPEETELYFSTLRQTKPKRTNLRVLKRAIRKEKAAARREAYLLFHKLLKRAMKYAHTHAPPLLMTPMLRIISDHVLELLAELHKVDVPKRTDTDNLSRFIISISDWTAVFVSNIYYQIEVDDRADAERMKQLEKVKSASTVDEVDTRKSKGPSPTEVDVTEKQIKDTLYSGAEGEGEEAEDPSEEAGGY